MVNWRNNKLSKKSYKLTKKHRKNISKALKNRNITWGDKISEAKKGHLQTNTGRTHFKKGQIPWNKNKNKYNITKHFLFQEYIENKKTLANISKKIGCSTSWVYKLLKKHRIKIRTIDIANKEINKGKYDGNSIVNHHIYLKENSDKTIKLTRSKHRQLHQRAYNYIYVRYGKKGINNYINWFKDNFINKEA